MGPGNRYTRKARGGGENANQGLSSQIVAGGSEENYPMSLREPALENIEICDTLLLLPVRCRAGEAEQQKPAGFYRKGGADSSSACGSMRKRGSNSALGFTPVACDVEAAGQTGGLLVSGYKIAGFRVQDR